MEKDLIISLVVAAASNHAIGCQGQLPWHLPADLRHFKNITWGLPVVMGRKTFASLGKPLPGRTNIVLSRSAVEKTDQEGIVRVSGVAAAMQEAQRLHAKELMVIGGGEIYRLFLPFATRIYLTRVEAVPEADTYFDAIDPAHWKLVSQLDREADAKNAFNCSFQVWERG